MLVLGSSPLTKTIEVGRLAVETGMWYLCEYQDGQLSFTYMPRERRPVSEYLGTQTRFRRMKPEHIARLQSMVDKRLAALEAKATTVMEVKP